MFTFALSRFRTFAFYNFPVGTETRHFGTIRLVPTSEVSGLFGISASVSRRQFGTDAEMSWLSSDILLIFYCRTGLKCPIVGTLLGTTLPADMLSSFRRGNSCRLSYLHWCSIQCSSIISQWQEDRWNDYRISTVHYNWPMSAHGHRPSSAHTLQHVTVPIGNIYHLPECILLYDVHWQPYNKDGPSVWSPEMSGEGAQSFGDYDCDCVS